MCGIAAVYAYGARSGRGAAHREQLARICGRMQCRGPDGAGTWVDPDERLGLGHRRLSIIDLSERGAQPMRSADGSCVITFNGEIYNYRALRAELEAAGHRFESDSDTEVLLRLYADRGEAMLRDVRGMFAFALWDAERRGLLLARDPFGIKPLYYTDDGTRFAAASEVKALLAGGGIDTTPEAAGHVGFFLWGHVPDPFTMYRGIRALPAGCTLWVDERGPREPRRYADVGEMLASAEREAEAIDPADAQARLREAMLDTVRHHLVADVDVGVFLSAGLDSTTLAALAAEVGHGRLRTVTLGFEEFRDTPRDEVPLAERVAGQYGAEHRTIWITRDDFRGELERLIDRMDQPTTDGVNSYFVSRAAAEAGLKVALSGLGGDELFGGYPSFCEIPRLVSTVRRVPARATIGRGVRVLSAPILRRFTSPKYAGLIEYGGDFGGAYLLRRGLFLPWEIPTVLDRDLVRAGLAELEAQPRLAGTIEGISAHRLKISALEATWYMRNQLLRDTDWASMSHSLEVRVPLVDWTLWSTVAPLLRASPALGKGAMARTPAAPLPDAVLERAKSGFGVPTREWIDAELGNGSRPRQRGLRGWASYVYQAAVAA